MLKTISRKTIKTIITDAYCAAYNATTLFGVHYRFKQGYCDNKGESPFVINGYLNYQSEFVPLSEIVSGSGILKNKKPLRKVKATSIERLLRQSFVGGKAWVHDDVCVNVKDFMRPIIAFINKHVDNLEVFASIYNNELTTTNVFGIYIKLKDSNDLNRLSWEITIDDINLVTPMDKNKFALKNIFIR